MNEIRIVIGSWGSYNEYNERALGSRWLDLADYGDWEEIEEALTEQGFELDGIDEELFIQDIDNFPSDATKGVKCTAIFNWFSNAYYADDKYGIIKED